MTSNHSANRRDFLHAAMGGLALSAIPGRAHDARAVHPVDEIGAVADEFDMSWTKRLTGRHKAVFDSPDIASGYGVLRAGLVATQYMDAFKLRASDISNVIVLRHDGIVLAMNQTFWDTYKIGETKKVTHPLTEAPITRNPAMLGTSDGVPPAMAAYALDRQMAAGTVVLACALAFRDVVDIIATQDKVSSDAATTRAHSMLIPGIVMQPSGVFATTLAQEKGCVYVRAT